MGDSRETARAELEVVVAKAIASDRTVASDGMPALGPEGQPHVEFRDDARTVVDALLAHPETLIAAMGGERVGEQLDRGPFERGRPLFVFPEVSHD